MQAFYHHPAYRQHSRGRFYIAYRASWKDDWTTTNEIGRYDNAVTAYRKMLGQYRLSDIQLWDGDTLLHCTSDPYDIDLTECDGELEL